MAFQIKQQLTSNEKEISSPVNTVNLNQYQIVLDKYDGREISSKTGCIAKDLYCAKINEFTGASETPILYIADYVLR